MEISKLPGHLKEGSVHLWVADLKTWRAQADLFKDLLSEVEKGRLNRLKIENKQIEFLCSRGLLRLILSSYIRKNPRSLMIKTTSSGKPFLPDQDIQFNLSHSGDQFICGISSGVRIGLDIQEIYTISSLNRIINNFFSPGEISYLESCPDHRTYKEHFFAIWTAKEAYLKAIGHGIQKSFNTINIIPKSAALHSFQLDFSEGSNRRKNWTIRALNITPGYKAAMAVNGTVSDLQEYRIFPEDVIPSREFKRPVSN